jgi:hypothetical protein
MAIICAAGFAANPPVTWSDDMADGKAQPDAINTDTTQLGVAAIDAAYEAMEIIAAIRTPRDTAVRFTESRLSPLLAAPLQLSGTVEFTTDGTLAKRITQPFTESISISASEVVLERAGKTQRLSVRRDGELWRLYTSLRAILAGEPATLEDSYAIAVTRDGPGWQLTLTPRDDTRLELLAALTVRGTAERIDWVRTEQTPDNWQEISFHHSIEPGSGAATEIASEPAAETTEAAGE